MSLLAPTALAAADHGTPGELISNGSASFTDTWDRMLERDRSDPASLPSPMPPRLTDYIVNTGFDGINLQDQYAISSWATPPGPSGAIGPNHFVEVTNGSVAIYARNGARLSHVALHSFFTVAGTPFPRNGTTYARVLYDTRSSRWFASCLELGDPVHTENEIILAVSRTLDPTGTWDKYVIYAGVPSSGGPTFWTYYANLGVDDNGVYFGVGIDPSSGDKFAKIVATPKANLIAPSPSLGTVYQWSGITDMWMIQPAHNVDGSSYGGAWFVGCSMAVWANIEYRTLIWPGGPPLLSATSELATAVYYSLANVLANQIGDPFDDPSIRVGDDRLQTAVVRNSHLWTCRTVGLSPDSYGNGTRSGCEWFEIEATTSAAAVVQSGRLCAYSGTFYNYFCPSLSANALGHAVMAFNWSSPGTCPGVWACRRDPADAAGTMSPMFAVKEGQGRYLGYYWGPCSATTVDPNDNVSFWTVHEYGTNIDEYIWGTWIGKIYVQPELLGNDSPASFIDVPSEYRFSINHSHWAAVGLKPQIGDHSLKASAHADMSSPYAASSQPGTAIDFVTANGCIWGNDTHYVQVHGGSNPDTHTIEAESEAADLVLGSTVTGKRLAASEILDLYQASLTAGTKYTVVVDLLNGTANAGVFVYPPSILGGGRGAASWSAYSAPAGMDETLTFTPTQSGIHGIVVTNHNTGFSDYKLAIGPTPANDECDSAVTIASLPYTVAQDTRFATTAWNDPSLACGSATIPKQAHSVWYKVTPSQSKLMTADTFASDYNTVLAVHTGSCGSFATIACNDDSVGTTSQVSWSATAGTTYYVEIAAFGGEFSGNLNLHVKYVPTPTNDQCSGAIQLSDPDDAQTVDTTGATTTGDPTPSCGPIYNSVWYKIRPMTTGVVVVSTRGTPFDTIVAAYSGVCGTLSEFWCNNDAIGSGGTYSALAFGVRAGRTYYIQVGGASAGAAGALSLQCHAGPTNSTVGAVKNAAPGSRVAICDEPISAVFPGRTYVEEYNRSSGVAVEQTGLAPGTVVTVIGIVGVDPSGNVVVTGGGMAGTSSGSAVAPVGMCIRQVGGSSFGNQLGVTNGSGLNNIGLLVRAWGRVASVDPETSSYWIDDGSGGIRVTDAQAIPVVGHYRAVTGIPWLSSPAGTAVLLEVSAQVVPE